MLQKTGLTPQRCPEQPNAIAIAIIPTEFQLSVIFAACMPVGGQSPIPFRDGISADACVISVVARHSYCYELQKPRES